MAQNIISTLNVLKLQFILGLSHDKKHRRLNMQFFLTWLSQRQIAILRPSKVFQSTDTASGKGTKFQLGKVGPQKWHPFFDFVCFSGHHHFT